MSAPVVLDLVAALFRVAIALLRLIPLRTVALFAVAPLATLVDVLVMRSALALALTLAGLVACGWGSGAPVYKSV